MQEKLENFIVHTSRLANNLDGTLFYLMIVNKTQSSYDHKILCSTTIVLELNRETSTLGPKLS